MTQLIRRPDPVYAGQCPLEEFELFYTDQRLSNKIILYTPQQFPPRSNYIYLATIAHETFLKTVFKDILY